MKIHTEKIWSGGDLRTLCRLQKWYTGGDNKEYESLLATVDEMEPTDGNILAVARDIADHTPGFDPHSTDDIQSIMFMIRRYVVSTFYTLEKEANDEW